MAANRNQHYWHAATPREWQNSDAHMSLSRYASGRFAGPIGEGFIKSFANPGGNITDNSNLSID